MVFLASDLVELFEKKKKEIIVFDKVKKIKTQCQKNIMLKVVF